MSNVALEAAKKAKDDEFYTRYEDVEKEMERWKLDLTNKRIHLFADTLESNFWKYFWDNFNALQLKQLTATSLEKKLYTTHDGVTVEEVEIETGDCLSDSILHLMRAHDICVTNPPFSIEQALIARLVENDINFLLVGPETLVDRKNLFNYFKDDRIKFGYNKVAQFTNPNGEVVRFGNITWITNLDKPDNPPLPLTCAYDPAIHLKADNYDCLNIDKLVDIPYDYDGVMAVPVTYMKKHCKAQFTIVGTTRKDMQGIPFMGENRKDYEVFVNGKKKFQRIFIQRRNVEA